MSFTSPLQQTEENSIAITRQTFVISLLSKMPEKIQEKLQGLSIASLKKHPALIPLYVCVIVGAVGAFGYLGRLALRNPDVSWNRSGNPNPNDEYRNKQYKFYSPIRDYSKIENPAPKYTE